MKKAKASGAVKIVKTPDRILRRRAVAVTEGQRKSAAFAALIGVMRATLDDIGVGLAAPQVGVSLRMFVMQDKTQFWKDKGLAAKRGRVAFPFMVVINPEWTAIGKTMTNDLEGCLSIPGLQGMVSRHRIIAACWIDQDGNSHEEKMIDWKARIFQHEYDHLDGKLYIDMISAGPKITYAREQSGVSAGLRARLLASRSRT